MFLVGTGTILAAYALIAWLPARLAQRRIEARGRRRSRCPPSDIDRQARIRVDREAAAHRCPCRSWTGSRAKMRWGSRLSGPHPPVGRRRSGVSTIVVISIVLVPRSWWACSPQCSVPACHGRCCQARSREYRCPYSSSSASARVRMARFEEQFPEALDLLSRAIRAGHAFTTAMSMVADEAPDPIGPEFKKTFEEQNFGIAAEGRADEPWRPDAPHRRAVLRHGCPHPARDGGNLSEILDNLAHVVRERFKILRQVRVYTAHGRMTGYVLDGPAGGACRLRCRSSIPPHMEVLFEGAHGAVDDPGHHHHAGPPGYVWIRQVVKIEV